MSWPKHELVPSVVLVRSHHSPSLQKYSSLNLRHYVSDSPANNVYFLRTKVNQILWTVGNGIKLIIFDFNGGNPLGISLGNSSSNFYGKETTTLGKERLRSLVTKQASLFTRTNKG